MCDKRIDLGYSLTISIFLIILKENQFHYLLSALWLKDGKWMHYLLLLIRIYKKLMVLASKQY